MKDEADERKPNRSGRGRRVRFVIESSVEQYRGENWMAHVECKGKDLELFFSAWTTEAALDVCERCPVMEECRNDVIENREYDIGVAGGATPGAIRRMRMQRRQAERGQHNRREWA